jgi:heptosyltransferase-1
VLRILIVKTSSLGDVVHALPVVDDVLRARPGAVIDWVVEESFADVPGLHRGIRRVIPVAIRRWRRSLWAGETRGEIGRFDAGLRAERYDLVVDLQGLAKSAILARRAHGVHVGYDRASAREPVAALAYERRFHVPRALHAIERNRRLAAAAIGFTLSGPPTVRLSVAPSAARPSDPYAVLLHATSAGPKLWPEASWIALGGAIRHAGLRVVLPWGSDAERGRSERIAAGVAGTGATGNACGGDTASASAGDETGTSPALVPPRLPLVALASVIAGAELVVGVDTGLVHLAAALRVPVVAIFADSDPGSTGATSFGAPVANVGQRGSAPSVDEVLAECGPLLAASPRC